MSAFLRQRWPETIIALLLVAAALREAEVVLAPLVLAFVTALVLAPAQNAFRRMGAPAAAAALATLFLALSVIAALMLIFRPWVADIIADWPQLVRELRSAGLDLRSKLTGLFNLQREVMEAIAPDSAGADAGGDGSALPSLADAAWLAPQVMAQALLFLGGLFFFLLGKDRAYGWAEVAGFTRADFENAEARVAHYFGAVSLINAGLGLAVGLALTAYGLPGAPVWGMVVALANFVIYLGPAVVAGALLLAGTVSFDGFAVVVPAVIYLSINLIEAQFVTPMVVGQRLKLDPLLVFLSLTIWLWLWGPIGGIVAIPLVLWSQALWSAASQRLASDPSYS
ncbi:AI-2E family transporter [Pararhodobacter zhoushanensis]|uniref:AI-2E family transporter n=1 Tax=Pararhodobacter zhoushanensis TaxID=2479545 RepID=UPI000F8D063F|nr:AI-2E family transporter [Pararhodobacter zhoushanensis]